MVGIRAGEGFQELQHIDQFALCGITPAQRLTFDGLLRLARRVAVLLHDDFRKPTGTIPPFSSAIANGLKGWLQQQTGSSKAEAVQLFFANSTGFRGLVWQPYSKDENGRLWSLSDPRIWHPPYTYTRTSRPTVLRERDIPQRETYGTINPDRKRKATTHSSPSGSRAKRPYFGNDCYTHRPGARQEFDADPCPDASSPPPPSVPQSPPGTKYTIRDLLNLGEMTGDLSCQRIAIACLPDRHDRLVTMGFENYRLRYRLEEIDIVGRRCDDSRASYTTYKNVTKTRHYFLGRFAGASERDLEHFALGMLAFKKPAEPC